MLVCVRACVSVGHKREPYKNGLTSRDAIWVFDLGWPKKPRVSWGLISPQGKGQFWGLFCPIGSAL